MAERTETERTKAMAQGAADSKEPMGKPDLDTLSHIQSGPSETKPK